MNVKKNATNTWYKNKTDTEIIQFWKWFRHLRIKLILFLSHIIFLWQDKVLSKLKLHSSRYLSFFCDSFLFVYKQLIYMFSHLHYSQWISVSIRLYHSLYIYCVNSIHLFISSILVYRHSSDINYYLCIIYLVFFLVLPSLSHLFCAAYNRR